MSDESTSQAAAGDTEQGQAPEESVLELESMGENPETGEGEKPILEMGEDGKGSPEKRVEKSEVPEVYEDFKMPEGFSMDESLKSDVCSMFKGMSLTQEQGQKLIDFYAGKITEMKQSELDGIGAQRKQWRDELRAQPDYERNRALAKKGLSQVAHIPGFKEMFTGSWMQDHPVLFRMFAHIGAMKAEDTPSKPGGGDNSSGDKNSERFPIKL